MHVSITNVRHFERGMRRNRAEPRRLGPDAEYLRRKLAEIDRESQSVRADYVRINRALKFASDDLRHARVAMDVHGYEAAIEAEREADGRCASTHRRAEMAMALARHDQLTAAVSDIEKRKRMIVVQLIAFADRCAAVAVAFEIVASHAAQAPRVRVHRAEPKRRPARARCSHRVVRAAADTPTSSGDDDPAPGPQLAAHHRGEVRL